MAFIVEQKIKGTTYVYQSVGYWDKEKQQARHRRICLGKKDPKTGKIIPAKSQIQPRACRDYGNYYLLNSIAQKLGIISLLRDHFPGTWQEILTCAFYEMSQRKPLYLCEPWSESTQTPSGSRLTSQRISELLKEIGKDDRGRLSFFRAWAKHRAEQEYIAFDITSISSYSKINEFLEFGYNRDGERLPQINLGMLFGETSLLPIFYNTAQGSIRDMSTLSNMIRYAEFLDMRRVRFVMDKGFYSSANVREMLQKGHKFAISVPFTTTLAKKFVDKFRKTICSPRNSFMVNGNIVYAAESMLRSGSPVRVFVYYDERNFLDAKENLLKRIMALEERLSGKKRVSSGFSHPCKKYLSIRHTKNGLHIRRNEKTISDALEYKGFLVIICNDKRSMKEIFHVYREKNAVERAFDNLKNELDLKRLRVHSEISMTGRMFVCFISLILYSWLDKRMKESDLYKRYTQEEVIAQLKRLKIVEMDDSKSMLTEISKNQKYLFEKLGIPEPANPCYNLTGF